MLNQLMRNVSSECVVRAGLAILRPSGFRNDSKTFLLIRRLTGWRVLLIVGDTNNGKTMIVNRFERLHLADDNPDGETIRLPVLIVQAPPTPAEGHSSSFAERTTWQAII
jgi:hypothetical protein